MKLAACYTVFDGCELLEKAIQTIAPHVDFFIVCWQSESFNGNQISQRDLSVIREMAQWQSEGYNLEVITFVNNHHLNAKENERLKHTRMITRARELGATHFLLSATDHFYDFEEFRCAKQYVEKCDFDSTFTKMYTYYKHPTWQIEPIEKYYMPFICKLHPHTLIEKVRGFPLLVDPSVQMNTLGNWHEFHDFEIMMHHYSMVRHDIRAKFTNAASPWKPQDIEDFTADWDNYDLETNPGIRYFQGRKVKLVPDYFGLSPIFEHLTVR